MTGVTSTSAAPMPWMGHRAVRSAWFWRAVAHLALDAVAVLTGFAVAVALVAAMLTPRRRGFRRRVEACASWERGRVAHLLGLRIPGPEGDEALLGRRVAYLVALPMLAAISLLVLVMSFSVLPTLALLPAYLPAMPGGVVHLGPLTVSSEGWALVTTAVAVAFALVVAPSLVRAAAALDRGVARALLGPGDTPDPGLTRRVEELVVSRARVVDSLEAERRRIERDLHDGAQQRLVALALLLGRAQARIDPEPGSALTSRADLQDLAVVARLLGQAHDEADAAIVELRDLTRGLAPPVLSERGLEPALSGLASRAALPVGVQVGPDVGRLPSSVEAVLYFVAAEALTNVAKHAAAGHVSIRLERRTGHACLTVTDDGRGGARSDAHGGLVGLADRLSGVDGTLRLLSPTGGPTTLTAEVPCA